MAIALGIFAYVVVFAVFGAWVAIQCRRSEMEGFLLGALFGPIGVIVEALLPSVTDYNDGD